MKKVFFLSDFFIDEIVGGAEICNDILIDKLLHKNIDIKKIKCRNIDSSFILKNKNAFYIVANFFTLSEDVKNSLINNKIDYIIYEHDHKYVSTNNPSQFKDFIVDEKFIINKLFFKSAKAVLSQSKIHSEIIQKNLLLKNLINLGGNLWSDEKINILKKNIGKQKDIEYAILETNNKNKGMYHSIDYCKNNNIKFNLIPFKKYESFIEELSRVKNLVFFPQWLETFSRVSVEAKILGCKLITNRLIGAASEEFFKKEPNDILQFLEKKNEDILNVFIKLINNESLEFLPEIQIPKISIITSLYNGGEFIENFLEDIVRQTIFKNCELLILDANSQQNEYEIIKKYTSLYDNIKYFKFDKRLNVHETLNKGIEYSSGEFLTIANVDDRRNIDCLEILAKHLMLEKDCDLVYGDTLNTNNKNEFTENCSSKNLYEHSKLKFSNENMIKCLPGPMPMWKKYMSIKNGKFDENLKYAGDWEYWLRCVKNGSKFKKIEFIVGSYYNNPNGLSTDSKNAQERYLEERNIFITYKDVFGSKVFNMFKDYFNAK